MTDLNKSIGLWQGTGMMLSIVLGAGLLALPGLAHMAAGSGALVVWLAAALVSVPLLVVFAIVGRAHPDAGGIAAVMRKAFGDPGYVCATFLFLGAVAVGLPSIALVGGKYAAATFGVSDHASAVALVVGAAGVNLMSARVANRLSVGLASAIILFLVLLAGFGWHAMQPGPELIAAVEWPGITVFGATFMMVFFAFTGWEVAANLAGEFRDPSRDLPLAMGLSFVIAVALYLVLAIIVAAAGTVGASAAPFADILRAGYGAGAGIAVSLVAIALIFANLTAAIWAVSRMVYSAATERLLPSGVAALSDGIPQRAVFLTMTVLVVVTGASYAGLLALDDLLAVAGMNFLLLYGGAAAALAVLSSGGGHRGLSLLSILIVVALILGRGIEHLIYPAILAGLGILIAAKRHGDERRKSMSISTGKA